MHIPTSYMCPHICKHSHTPKKAHICTKHMNAHIYCTHMSTHVQALSYTHTHTHTYHIGPFMAGLITWPVQELVVLGDFQVVLNFHPFHQEDHPPGFLLFLRIRFIVQAKLSTHKHTALPTHVQTKIANTQEDLLSNTHITSILFLLLMSTEYWKKKIIIYKFNSMEFITMQCFKNLFDSNQENSFKFLSHVIFL